MVTSYPQLRLEKESENTEKFDFQDIYIPLIVKPTFLAQFKVAIFIILGTILIFTANLFGDSTLSYALSTIGIVLIAISVGKSDEVYTALIRKI